MVASSFPLGHRVFRQTYTIRLALAIPFLIFAALFTLAAIDPHAAAGANVSWAITAGIVLTYAVLWVLISKTTLTISAQGIRHDSIFGSQELLWQQIAETRYVVNPINWGAHFGLIGAAIAAASKTKGANLTLTVIANDGKKIKITSNFQNCKEAISAVLERTLPPLVSSLKARIERGETVKFGALSLSKNTISWKSKDPIPLSELKSAELAGPSLSIKRNGKWLSAISVRSDKIPNVLALLEVLEGLAPQLKSSGIDPLARVRM